MSEYQVIARKYRPQRFADVVGQDHVVRTLRNAIQQNRTAHAYLFVGPRGVGKTTLARIFAKAMNCENPQDGEPCCKCRSCLAIAAENSLDVIEIDAASHNSAGEMRELADEVMHMPVASRYKIYIIDEVHMLSNQAWNALLKTVEEPPAHVKFIFATTEVHKVLATIISRCQRFDLMPIQTRVIARRLLEIAAEEKIAIDPGAIEAIARAADGGMRDAQSLLDQMFAFFAGDDNKSISAEQVLSLFGLTDATDLDAILKAMLTDTPAAIPETLHRLSVKGKNLETLFDDLVSALRAVQLCLLLKNPADVLDESEENIARFAALGKLASPETVGILLETLAPVGRILHDALNKQVFLETLLLKAMREAHAIRIADLVARLNQLRTAGELHFLDKLPPPQKTPPPVIEALPEANQPLSAPPEPIAAVPAPAQESPLPETDSDAEADDPVSEAEADCDEASEVPAPPTPEELYRVFLSALGSEISPKTVEILALGQAKEEIDDVLRVEFPISLSPEDYALATAQNAALEAIYRSANGRLDGELKFTRAASYEWSGAGRDPAEVAVNTVEDSEVEPVDPTPEPMDLDEPDCAPPAPPPLDASGDVGAMELPERCVGVSVMNDPRAVAAANADPTVRNLLDLFGGRVADIHIDKIKKGSK